MVARLAIMSAGLPVDLGVAKCRRKPGGDFSYTYGCEGDDVFVLAHEFLKDEITPYARIPVLASGDFPSEKEIENQQRYWKSFRFDIGETFNVVEVLKDTFWISEVKATGGQGHYVLACRYIASTIETGLCGANEMKGLERFIPAIKRGAERFIVVGVPASSGPIV